MTSQLVGYLSTMKTNRDSKDPSFQGDAGWGVAQKDAKFIMIESPPDSQNFVRVLRTNSNVQLPKGVK